MQAKNQYGRIAEEMDFLRWRMAARSLAATKNLTAYGIFTEDGAPLAGMHDGTPAAEFTAIGWKMYAPQDLSKASNTDGTG